MSPEDAEAMMLLTAHLLALVVACVIFGAIFFLHRRAKKRIALPPVPPSVLFRPVAAARPRTWIAIRAATPATVQRALGLNRSMPCSWSEGMTGEHDFFISQRINGWVIVTGAGLPNPSDDVDASFLFLIALSRKLGHVQFFHAENFSRHHAWARLDDGYVTRAYAWADGTVWQQGEKTALEMELDLRCFGYGEDVFPEKILQANCDKVPLLAARWSLDPARVSSRTPKVANGFAGESSPVY
jgi:hypothetical protein